MEAINDASRLIAKALKEINAYLLENDICNDRMLEEACRLLEKALEQLVTKK